MCGSTLFGFLVGVLIVKALRRFWYVRHGGCPGGHGWGGHHHHRHFSGWGGPDGADPGRWSRRWGQGAARASSGKPLAELVRGLELNERQKEEAYPVFALIKDRLGTTGPRVELALSIVAAERFDPSPLLPELGDLPGPVAHELCDALEHLHTILISEQREILRSALNPPATPSPASAPPPPASN